jgi:hypothetical protein
MIAIGQADFDIIAGVSPIISALNQLGALCAELAAQPPLLSDAGAY